ncbi:shikimate transporter, partial [Salmonella enterica]|nr:shikimate transporter [Salmonella enterica]ECY2635729.1 shikimate transporter [Salmonella enterica]EHS2163494.1 prophage tail fiber N-terminal domain-containing protein [Salmonella enterica subsp. enterica serovar Muenchen]ELE5204917.1 prophage tail fiber N-terminal domain-containing protein [Salmonella enterica]
TLNDFLGAMTEDDVRPEALRRFEAMVEEVARQASEALRNATAAGQASEQAQTSAERAGASETAAKMSETQAASSAGETGASATAAAASEKAAAASAAEAKTSETNAATSANTAAASATAASSSASAASTHAAASDTSASLAAQSSTAAGAAATRAEDAAKRAEDIADVISLEDASLTKKGIVKLSSAADSDSEVLAATPKAVKTVMGEVQTKAPLDSPAFTGTPTTPTPPDDAKGLQTANAEFVRKLIAALVGSVPESLDTLQELADALGNDPNFATTVLNKLAGKQPLDDTLTALSGKSVDGLIEYVGLRETINRAAGALQKDQNGADIPDKKQFARTIGAVTSTSVTFGESGWFKIATVFMPQATSTAVIKLYGGSGFNVGSFEQAAISELVLRAGNGSPVGITATLWRRSPAAANEIAWINTSGDSYDIYINIGRYAYGLIAQYDCTSNAGVILHTSPEFSETKPANATNGQTYTLFNSLMKPTAGDVEALSVSGGRLNGPLGIGTDNALGGNSIVFGDNDTGLKQNGDGILDIFANNQHTVRVAPGEMIVLGAIRAGNGKKLSLTSTNNSALNAGFNLWGDGGNRPTVIELGDDQGWHLYSQRNTDGSIQFVVNGQVIPDNYGNFDARYLSSGNVYTKGESDNRYVQNIQRGAPVWPGKVDEYGPAEAPAGCFLTQARHDPTTAYGVTFAYRPLQMWVGNGWRTING